MRPGPACGERADCTNAQRRGLRSRRYAGRYLAGRDATRVGARPERALFVAIRALIEGRMVRPVRLVAGVRHDGPRCPRNEAWRWKPSGAMTWRPRESGLRPSRSTASSASPPPRRSRRFGWGRRCGSIRRGRLQLRWPGIAGCASRACTSRLSWPTWTGSSRRWCRTAGQSTGPARARCLSGWPGVPCGPA
jgi:hypothetical protein